MTLRSFAALAFGLALLSTASLATAQGGSMGVQNPFSPPGATIHYAPDRQYDLQHLALEMNVDYPNKSVKGRVVNSIAALRDGIHDLKFHSGRDVKIDSVSVNGQEAHFTKVEDGLTVQCGPMKVGAKADVAITFHFAKAPGNDTGFHWLEPTKVQPNKIGFWTNGESVQTRDWVPTWDYPNDFTTSETKTTVPADWSVIGNGVKVSDELSADKSKRTVVWKLNIPHATYLTSVLAGPLDIKHDKWRGVDLWYAVPRGRGHLIDYSFEDTKDMLSFYSDRLGYKYPWPKYAQDCTFEFGGGQENVSATTLGQDFLTDKRSGIHDMDSLNSHELGHQWFGDTVTCKDWGQIWLNESFATFMQMMYFEHSRGTYAYQREIQQNSLDYFDESRRYKRPLVTTLYMNSDVMFDQHTYPKGGVLIHSLRRMIGDGPFFAGLKSYLEHHQHTPVETSQLMEEMTDVSGTNLAPWFKQWIYSPGHPVIDWSWNYDVAKQAVMVHVKQTQPTADGTPVYDIPAQVGLLHGGVKRFPIHLDAADQTFTVPVSEKPDAVVFDPDFDFLREIKTQPWTAAEWPAILKFAPNCIDRVYALRKIMAGSPTDQDLRMVLDVLRADQGPFPAFVDTGSLRELDKPFLADFFISELKHEAYERRTEAAQALAKYKTPAVFAALRGVVDDSQPYAVVAAAINGLAANDFKASAVLIRKQAASTNPQIRGAALKALASNHDSGALDEIFKSVEPGQTDEVRNAGYTALRGFKGDDPRVLPAVRAGLKDLGRFTRTVIGIAGDRKMKEVLTDLDSLLKRYPFLDGTIQEAKKKIQS